MRNEFGGTAESPSWVVSKYDNLRYLARILRYRYKLMWEARDKSMLPALLGLLLGILGAATTLAAVYRFIVDRRPATAAVLGAAIVVVVLLARRIAHPQDLFRIAARSARGTEILRRNMADGMRNEAAFDALHRLYAPFVEGLNATLAEAPSARRFQFIEDANRKPFLAIVIPALADESLDELLDIRWKSRANEWTARHSRFAPERQQYMESLRSNETHRNPWGDEAGDNLVLDELEINTETGNLLLHTAVATYGEIVRTSDSLLSEFAIFAYLGRPYEKFELSPIARTLGRLPFLRIGRAIELRSAETLTQLPWRRHIHEWAPSARDLFLRPACRAAGIGVAVTMVKRDGVEPVAYVARRSSRVGTYPDALHVVPAGMCNAKFDPAVGRETLPADFLKWTMIGELLEECYDVEELATYGTENWVTHIKNVCSSMGVEPSPPTFTGLAFDLLTLRPEVCSTVDVISPRASSGPINMRLCWEYSRTHDVSTIALARIGELCSRTDFVQSGAASLGLAAIGAVPTATFEGT